MEEEYLSLYEPVDEFQLERNKITHNNYEKLKTSHCNHEEYQQPQSVTTQRDYSEKIHIDIELQLIKKDMRRVKTCFCIGGLIMLVLVTVSLITLIALSIRVSKKSVNVTRIKEINTIGNGSVYIPNDIASVRVFEDCFQESVNCSFSKVDEGIWLSCATDNLNLNKKVSLTRFIIHTVLSRKYAPLFFANQHRLHV